MPAWIHERAKHLLAKSPSMDKSQAFAIATQQGHKLGKNPKGYGTKEGKKDARAKYDKPRKEYMKTPNPGKLESAKLAAMRDELFLIKQAGLMTDLAKRVGPKASRAAPAVTGGGAQARGVLKQMSKGRNYGGAAVDPFVKMRG